MANSEPFFLLNSQTTLCPEIPEPTTYAGLVTSQQQACSGRDVGQTFFAAPQQTGTYQLVDTLSSNCVQPMSVLPAGQSSKVILAPCNMTNQLQSWAIAQVNKLYQFVLPSTNQALDLMPAQEPLGAIIVASPAVSKPQQPSSQLWSLPSIQEHDG